MECDNLQSISTRCADGPTTTHYGDTGIDMKNAGNNLFALHNTVTGSSNLGATGCTASPVYDGPGTGIALTAPTTAVIADNTVTGAFRDAISQDAGGEVTLTNVDMLRNTVSGYLDDGLEVKGGNLNVRVGSNVITADQGNSCIAANDNTTDNWYGPLYLFRNTCYATNSSQGRQIYKLGGAPMYLFHNSSDGSGAPTGVQIDTIADGGAPIVVLNNIFKSSGAIVLYAGDASRFDYNLDEVVTGASYAYLWNGTTTYDTWSAWRTGTGQEAHGLSSVDPSFKDTTLHLNANSPAIDTGVAIANFNGASSAWPTSGAGPDMGAYEYPQGDITTGLVNHYTFDAQNAADSGSGGVNGTLVNSPPFVAKHIGAYALSLASANTQYVNLGTTVQEQDPVTWAAWVNPTTLPGTYNAIAVATNGTNAIAFYVRSDGKLATYVAGSGGWVIVDGTGTHTLTTGSWWHVAFSYDQTNGLKVYVNGALDGTAGAQGTDPSSVTAALGNDPAYSGRSWNGAIDDVRLYSRALTSTDITALYNYR